MKCVQKIILLNVSSSFHFKNAVVAAEVTSLVSGINGATVVSAFSSSISGSFVVARSVPATAVLLAEPVLPIIPLTSRQSSTPDSSHHHSCPRPIINVGAKLKTAEKKISPILGMFSKLFKPIIAFNSLISKVKTRIFQKLGLMCVIPKLTRPFVPFFKHFQCKLGLNEDDFMEAPPCNASACIDPVIEDREITRDIGLPNLDDMVDGMDSTLDDCFADMTKVEYGSRILAKLVDDMPCEDPKFNAICKDLMDQKRMISEEDCQSPG